MLYCDINFKTKKELKEAVAKYLEAEKVKPGSGRAVTVYATEPYETAPTNGKGACGGPHYPQPHKWYAEIETKDGVVVKVK